MNVAIEAQHVDMHPSWKSQVETKLGELSDPRDPIISVRGTFSFHQGEKPPAEVRLVMAIRGKSLVAHKKGDNCDVALKLALDTAKRELRKHYDLRSSHKHDGIKDLPLADTPIED